MGAGLELGSSAIIMHFCLFAYFVKFFWGGAAARVSVCSLGCPRTHSVDQAELKLTDPPASAC